jgi:hypothetical protein
MGRATCGHPEKKYAARGLCWMCYKRAYRKTPKGKAAMRRGHIRHRRRHPEKYNERRWRSKGIACTSQQYYDMLAAQGGVCAICEKTTKDALHVDHCHMTGRVRGLLCNGCNLKLGWFELRRGAVLRYLAVGPV